MKSHKAIGGQIFKMFRLSWNYKKWSLWNSFETIKGTQRHQRLSLKMFQLSWKLLEMILTIFWTCYRHLEIDSRALRGPIGRVFSFLWLYNQPFYMPPNLPRALRKGAVSSFLFFSFLFFSFLFFSFLFFSFLFFSFLFFSFLVVCLFFTVSKQFLLYHKKGEKWWPGGYYPAGVSGRVLYLTRFFLLLLLLLLLLATLPRLIASTCPNRFPPNFVTRTPDPWHLCHMTRMGSKVT